MKTPTVVLVHGAFADASGYAAIITDLMRTGISVRAPMNPLRGLASDAEALARYTTTIDGPILLRRPLLRWSRHLASCASCAPGDGAGVPGGLRTRGRRELCERAGAVSAFAVGEDGGPEPVRRARRSGWTGPVHQDRRLSGNLLRRPSRGACLRHGGKPTAAERRRPDGEGLQGWLEVTAVLVSGIGARQRDSPDAERFMAKRMGATTESVSGSHVAFIARPEIAAGLIRKAVAAAG